MEKFVAPKFHETAFNCPYCSAYAVQHWYNMRPSGNIYKHNKWCDEPSTRNFGDVDIAECEHCHKNSLWVDGNLLIPASSNIPPASDDMPENVSEFYNEAIAVFNTSPRSAAALLRLALQILLKELGESGTNINDDIGNLVKKGLPAIVQQAADTVRFLGNQAVHPGTIDFNDNSDTASTLFSIINLIVRYMITTPKEIGSIYETLPSTIKEQITHRDSL